MPSNVCLPIAKHRKRKDFENVVALVMNYTWKSDLLSSTI